MKILVTCFSQTGNTEKIGKAIHSVVSQGNETEFKNMEDVEADTITGYDLIFVGSPLHAGNLSEQAKEFMAKIQPGSCQKLAGFITHCAPAYPDQEMAKFTGPFTRSCDEKDIQYMGCFSCQGFLTEPLHDMVKDSQNATDEQWTEIVKDMTGHPNEEDEANAREFAREVLKK